jgi:drug/metabolite transporter (DMT)-like permease
MTAAQVFRHEMPQTETLPFQAVLFVSAFAVTSIIYFARRERVDRSALNLGALLGAANLGNYLFLVLALAVLPGIAVYPAIAAGEVGLSAAAGVIFWREKLGVRSWVGIGLTVAALLLIQLGRARLA